MSDQIGRFYVRKRLGGGGFGEVFLADDRTIARQVAIKVFRPKDENLIAFATSSNTEGLEVLRTRFLSEARILATLHDEPHVVDVLEFGELPDGTPYYVMPYLPQSLAQELGKDVFDVHALAELPAAERPRALPLEAALDAIEQTLKGLAAAHARGLVHRDIKPANLMRSEKGLLRIVDFGIAKAPEGQHSTISHLAMGSRNYMAPEQRESAKHVDARADVYSVGVVAYRALLGKLPIGRFVDPNVSLPALDKAMNELILRMLAQDKAERPADAAEALKLFQQARKSVGVQNRGGEHSGTWVGEQGASGMRDELKPLQARIVALLGEYGFIPAAQREGLLAMAAIGDLDEAGLDGLIDDTLKSNKLLNGKHKLAQLLLERLSSGAVLNAENLQAYAGAAQAVGWTPDELQRVAQALRVAATAADKPAQPGDREATPSIAPMAKPRRPLPVALAVLVLLGGGLSWGVYNWRQGQIAAEVRERAHTAQASEEAAAWQTAQQVNTAASYSAYLVSWPQGKNAVTARQRQIAASQAEQAKSRQPGERFRDCATCPEMVVIPAGSFVMGSPSTEEGREADEGPQRTVRVAAFAMGRTEVSFAEYDRFVDATGHRKPDDVGWGRGQKPVVDIDWEDAKAYAAWLSEQTGELYRLPSEAEWEYATRAGTTGPFSFNGTLSAAKANYDSNRTYGGSVKDSGGYRGRTVDVGSLPANPWGLHEVHGNVQEWVEDCWNENYSGAPTDGSVWTSGNCGLRIARGGSWNSHPRVMCSADRYGTAPGNALREHLPSWSKGFRLARTF